MYRPDTSPDSGAVPSGEGQSPLDRLLDVAVGLSVYDVILLGIPMLLVGGVLGGRLFGAPTTTGVSVGSTLALLLVGYGLFGDPPKGLEE